MVYNPDCKLEPPTHRPPPSHPSSSSQNPEPIEPTVTVVDKQPISCPSQPLCVMLRHSPGLKLPVEVLTDISPAASVVSELAVLVIIMTARPTSVATIRKNQSLLLTDPEGT